MIKVERIEYEFREKALKDYNSSVFDAKEEGIREGIKKGKIEGKIEAVIKLINKYKVSLSDAMKDMNLDVSHKAEVIKELNKLGIKYVE